MSIEAGDILRVTLSYTQANSSLPQNVFLFKADSSASDDSEIVADWVDWATNYWHPAWKEFASVEVSIAHVGVDVLGLNGHVLANIGASSLALIGDVTGEPTVAAASGYLLAYTPFPKSRGSKYVPGPGKDGVADNKFGSLLLAALAEMLVIYLVEYTGTTTAVKYAPGIIRRLPELWAAFNETGYITDIPSYQRRRKPNVGS